MTKVKRGKLKARFAERQKRGNPVRGRKLLAEIRNRSNAFSKLDASGKTGRGTNITQIISEDREDRI
jgi:hypothetical protein